MDWNAIGKFLWEWLPLIAVSLAVYNIFLKSYITDWWAWRNKKSVAKRLRELEFLFYRIRNSKVSPTTFFIEVIQEAKHVFAAFMFCITSFIFGVSIFIISYPDGYAINFLIARILLYISPFLGIWCIITFLKLLNSMIGVRYPEGFAITIIKFVDKAKRKNLIANDAQTLADTITQESIFTDRDREYIQSRVNTYRQKYIP